MEEGKKEEENKTPKFSEYLKNVRNKENQKDLIDKESNIIENQKTKKNMENKKFQNLNEEETNNNDTVENIEKLDDSTNNEKVDETDESGFEYENGNPYENSFKDDVIEKNIKEDKNQKNESTNIINSKDKPNNKNIENNNQNQTKKDLIPKNDLKDEIIPQFKNITKINISNKSPLSDNNARSSDYDPQYEKYIEYPEDGDGQNLDSEIKGKDSIKASGAQIANTIMGAGILSIPIIMRYIGFLLGIIFIIFLAFCTLYSVFILIRCHEITGKNGFSMLGKITMGKFGSILIKVIIIINNLGFCVAYFRIFGEVLQTIIQGWVSPDSFWANNWHNFIYILLCSFIMFSFIFIKNLSISSKKSSLYWRFRSASIFIRSYSSFFT